MKTQITTSNNRRRNTVVGTFLCSMIVKTITTTTSTSAFVIQQQHQCNKRTTNVLNMGKNSDRAHIERHLEEMMGDDWREFRARLVAREHAEEKAAAENTKSKSSISNNHQQQQQQKSSSDQPNESNNNNNKALNKQSQLGDLFAGAIHSIFNTQEKKVAASSTLTSKSIFDGDTIGGVISSPSSSSSKKTTTTTTRSSYIDFAKEAASSKSSSSNNSLLLVNDPFVSAEEVPCHLSSGTTIKNLINKHRWAHSIGHVETGCVLIANEKLGGVFHQTIVLIIQHNDHVGSIGIVINRPYEGDLLKIASEKESKLDLSLKLAFTSSPVTYGGPVLTDEYSILHGFGEVDGSTKLCPGVYVGGSEELMNEVRCGQLDPKQTLFAKGHAAWTPKQLQREISKGVWYVAAVSSDLILRYAGAPITTDDNTHDLWADILSCMGGKYTTIASTYSSRGDNRLP